MPSLPGMKAGGYYDEHSTYQRVTVEALGGWIDLAVEAMVLPEETQAFTVADYGCSEGANSIRAVGMAVDAFRRRRPEQPVCGIHTDLPVNNFNRVFVNLNDPLTSTYLQDHGRRRPNVCALSAGGSFYGPVLPPGSVHFAMSFTAVVWLDRLPEVAVPEFVGYMEASAVAQQAFADQAAQDLASFYRYRADELAPGAKLLVVVPGSDGKHRCSDGLYNLLNDAGVDTVAAGSIDPDRWRRFAVPTYFRTLEEMTGPLHHAAGPGAGAFIVDRAELLDLPIPFKERFRQTGDVQAYAAEYVGFMRAFSEPVLARGLNADAAALDALYRRAAERLTAQPVRYDLRNLEVAILLTRV